MKTYRLQYRCERNWAGNSLGWANYLADDGSPVEFIQQIHAESVARDLGAEGYQGCCRKDDWRIVTSTGEYLPISLS